MPNEQYGHRPPASSIFAACILCASALLSSCAGRFSPAPLRLPPEPARNVEEFEQRLERIREGLAIPAFSACITRDGEIVWARGFGLADVESGTPATPETSYHLASLTKTFASTVILQLVETGQLDLEAPVAGFGIDVKAEGVVRVRHLLTHTSEGVPGKKYRYNGARFGLLDKVIEGTAKRSFGELLVERIVAPLGLKQTAPNIADAKSFALAGHDPAQFERNLAKPYEPDRKGRPVGSKYPDHFSTAAGLIASVIDVARYNIALDDDKLLRAETKARAFTPATSIDGRVLPYGLGWFVEEQGGVKLVWHYGYWVANSSLIIKVPERRLNFIILANTDMLSRPFNLGAGEVMVSPVAREFVNAFVLGAES